MDEKKIALVQEKTAWERKKRAEAELEDYCKSTVIPALNINAAAFKCLTCFEAAERLTDTGVRSRYAELRAEEMEADYEWYRALRVRNGPHKPSFALPIWFGLAGAVSGYSFWNTKAALLLGGVLFGVGYLYLKWAVEEYPRTMKDYAEDFAPVESGIAGREQTVLKLRALI